MNQDKPATLPVHSVQPSQSAGFYATNSTLPVNIVGAPLFTPRFFARPPSAVPCAFFPAGSPAFMPTMSNASWSTGVRMIQPTALVDVQHYMQPVEMIGQQWTSLSAGGDYQLNDRRMLSFQERAKKCGIRIEPTTQSLQVVEPPASTSATSVAEGGLNYYYGATPVTNGMPDVLLAASSQLSFVTESSSKSVSDTNIVEVPVSAVKQACSSVEPPRQQFIFPHNQQQFILKNVSSSSEVSLDSSSAQSFTSAKEYSGKCSVQPNDTFQCDDGSRLSMTSSQTEISGCAKLIGAQSTNSDLKLADRSWQSVSSIDCNDDIDLDSHASFHSPSSREHRLEGARPVQSAHEFTMAAERWRQTELGVRHHAKASVQTQTQILMTVNACVGTEIVLVDASTNTDDHSEVAAVVKSTGVDTTVSDRFMQLNLSNPVPEPLTEETSFMSDDRISCAESDASHDQQLLLNNWMQSAATGPAGSFETAGGRLSNDFLPSSHSHKHHHFLGFQAAMAGGSQSACHDCPLSSTARLGRGLGCSLDVYESSEGSKCSAGRSSSHAAHSSLQKCRANPAGVQEMLGASYDGASSRSEDITRRVYGSQPLMVNDEGNIGSVDSFQGETYLRPDDVYYSDEEVDYDVKPDSFTGKGARSNSSLSVSSAGVVNTAAAAAIAVPDIPGMSTEEQRAVQQLMAQMVLANPLLAAVSPVIVQELALRYLLSAQAVNPAAAVLEQHIRQTLLSSAGADANDADLVSGMATALSDEGRYSSEMSDHLASSRHTVRSQLSAAPSSDTFGHSQLTRPSYNSVSAAVDDDVDVEHRSTTLRGCGRSATSSHQTSDSRELRPPRGRGRGRATNQASDDSGSSLVTAERRPGSSSSQPHIRTVPLRAPAVLTNKSAGSTGQQLNTSSSASSAGYYQRQAPSSNRRETCEGENWDSEIDESTPRVFAVDSSFFKTSHR